MSEYVVTGAQDVGLQVLVPVHGSNAQRESLLVAVVQRCLERLHVAAAPPPLVVGEELEDAKGLVYARVQPAEEGLLTKDAQRCVQNVGGNGMEEEAAHVVHHAVALEAAARVPQQALHGMAKQVPIHDAFDIAPRDRIDITRSAVEDGRLDRGLVLVSAADVEGRRDQHIRHDVNGNPVSDERSLNQDRVDNAGSCSRYETSRAVQIIHKTRNRI